MLKKTGNILIAVAIVIFIIAIKLWIGDSGENGISSLIGKVISISFFVIAFVTFITGTSRNASEKRRKEEEKKGKEEEEKKIANLRKEIKQEILDELKDKKDYNINQEEQESEDSGKESVN